MKSLAFINVKGGCGKTTSSIQVAGVLADINRKKKNPKEKVILFIDLDRQMNSTQTLLSENEEEIEYTMYDLMAGKCRPEDCVKKSYFRASGNSKPKYFGIDVIPADIRMKKEADLEAMNIRIKDDLQRFALEQGYDWIIADVPCSSDVINRICFTQIANNAIVPVSSDTYSMTGYGQLIEDVNEARKSVSDANSQTNILGVYMSRFTNCTLDRQFREILMGLNELFIDIQIPQRMDVRTSLAEGRPLSFYHTGSYSRSREAYEKLTRYIQENAI